MSTRYSICRSLYICSYLELCARCLPLHGILKSIQRYGCSLCYIIIIRRVYSRGWYCHCRQRIKYIKHGLGCRLEHTGSVQRKRRSHRGLSYFSIAGSSTEGGLQRHICSSVHSGVCIYESFLCKWLEGFSACSKCAYECSTAGQVVVVNLSHSRLDSLW